MSGFFYGKGFRLHLYGVKKSPVFIAPTVIATLAVITFVLSLNDICLQIRPYRKPEMYSLILPSIKKNGFFTEDHFKNEVQKKKIRTYILTGTDEDSIKFRLIREDAIRMKFTCDTSMVIKVHFRNEATYGEFFYLNRLMKTEKIKRYAFVDPAFFIFGPPRQDCLEDEAENVSTEVKAINL